MGLLTRGQERFAGQLSRETGLNPRVVGAWTLAEQSGGAAQGYEQRGYHNWLNIANTDSGPAGGAHSSAWRNPVTAARATAQWLRGQGPITQEYGRAAPGILSILRSGSNPQAQINAIAKSGWASSGYNGGADLRSLFAQLHGFNPPQGETGGSASVQGQPQTQLRLSTQEAPGPDPALVSQLEQMLTQQSAPAPVAEQAQLARPAYAPKLPGTGNAPPPLTPAPEADPAAKLRPLLEQLAGSSGESSVKGERVAVSGPEQALTNAVPHGTKLRGFLPGNAELQVSRIDQGQDIRTNAGGPILAPGNGFVVDVKDNPGGFGERYPIVKFTSGPLAGHTVYIGHTHSALPVGAHFQAGTVLSHTGHGTPHEGNARTPGWAEIGLWGPSGPGNMEAGKQIAPLLGLR